MRPPGSAVVAAACCLAAAVLVAGAAGGGVSADQRGIALLADLGAVLRASPVWTVAYRQEYVPAGMSSGETVEGRVWIAWPDRALFKAAGDEPRVMGVDGRRVRLVDPEAGSCEDHVLTEEEWQRIPLAAVLDPASAAKRFAVTAPNAHTLVLRPLRPGGVSRVEIVLGAGGLPSGVRVVDPQGAVNRFRFSSWRKLARAPFASWLPAPPPDVACTGPAAPE